MRHLFVYFTSALLVFTGCKTIQYVPVETIKEVYIKDTTVLHKTDTLIQVPEVSIADFIDVRDTLVMEASYSTAKAWVDTTYRLLKGSLVQGGKLPVQIVEKERLVYRDSIITKEVPVEVEVEKIVKVVPRFWKFFGVIGLLSLIAGVVLILRKFHII